MREIQPISGACVWLGRKMAGSSRWRRQLSDAQLVEIDRAVRQASTRGLGWQRMTADDFPLPSCAALAEDIRAELEDGSGIVLLLEKNNQRAVPVVLTLQQLDANDGMDQRLYSPSLDLTPKDGSLPLEVDFVWMICGDARRRNVVILGECKDRQQDEIDANDVQNLRRVADALPRSRFKTFILLAKLAPFTAQEIALAQTLNGERQRRVIMLAARELEPYRLFDRTKDEYPGIMQYATSPEDWALVTAQIYFREAPEPK